MVMKDNFGQTVKGMEKGKGGIGKAVSAAAHARNAARAAARTEGGIKGTPGKEVYPVYKTY
jgi:hypothetical protein